jgi:hypothetical protein
MRLFLVLFTSLMWAQTTPPAPAEQVYKNIQVLKGMPATRVPMVMGVFNRVLGVECTHCHVEGAMEKEDKPAFGTTRKMFEMRNWIAQTQKVNVACWTCHRGAVSPNKGRPEVKDIWPAELKLTAEQEKKPAREVYKNLRFMNGPAEQISSGMSFMASALGVGCVHCHVDGAWEKDDKPAKETARKMLALVRDTRAKFQDIARISCFTCHHGGIKPEINPPAAP